MPKNKQHYLIGPSGPVLLPLDKHFFFGRAEGNSIVVDDTRASRRHAELYWDDSAFILIDLNSSNGTLLNGKPITSCLLKDQDEIQIGLQAYTYRIVNTVAELDTAMKEKFKAAQAMVTSEMPALKSSALPDTDFNGTLATMSVTEIVQMMELGQRGGMLLVINEKKEKGILYLREGQIISAEFRLLDGDAAALAVLKLKQGSFSFRVEHPSPKPNVKQKTAALLLEAARHDDEDSRG